MENNINIIRAEKKPTMKLYRYFRNIDYAIEEIETGKIYLPFSDSFNDPFDCKIVNNGEALNSTVKFDKELIIYMVNRILLECNDFFVEFYKQGYDFGKMEKSFFQNTKDKDLISSLEYVSYVHKFCKRSDSLKEFVQKLEQSYVEKQPLVALPKRVACFSEKKDSILMWSYYADKHNGVCLEYNPSILDFNNQDNIKLYNGLQKVYYSENQYNNAQYFKDYEDLNNMFFNKALCWAHEQEWRLVINENIDRITFPCLTGVYLGVNFRDKYNEEKFQKLIRTVIKDKNQVGLFEAQINHEKYVLDFKKLN